MAHVIRVKGLGEEWIRPTQGRMHNLQQSKRLRPFGELAHAAIDILEADEGNQEENAAEDSEPEDGTDEIVADQILRLLATMGSITGVHWGGS
jgi:hypothetical protein